MKPGSLVTAIRPLRSGPCVVTNEYGVFGTVFTLPEFGKIYTVRNVAQCEATGSLILMFEEMVMGKNINTGDELGAPIELFRELIFPPDLDLEIEALVNEPYIITQ